MYIYVCNIYVYICIMEVAAPDFLPASTTVEIEEGTACEHWIVNVNITLKPKPEEFPCPKANISVLVQDKLVTTTLPGARVVIRYQVIEEQTSQWLGQGHGELNIDMEIWNFLHAIVSRVWLTLDTFTRAS